jgi:DNA modification methylase
MSWEIRTGDCLDLLRSMPAESVHCCVTSPPYWGLRDYGTARWEGGDAECEHVRLKRGDHSTIDGGNYQSREIYREACGKCGAVCVDGQLGLERTPEEYIAKMVEVFRELRRVLRNDGTLWLNIGDCYQGGNRGTFGDLKPKDLVGIPWMLAFALRADGWWLRQDIIWSKPNPMPESVTDRCTKAHEYLFLLTKSARYYFNQEPSSSRSA